MDQLKSNSEITERPELTDCLETPFQPVAQLNLHRFLIKSSTSKKVLVIVKHFSPLTYRSVINPSSH